MVFLDGRNAIEAEVGRFKGAVVADVGRTPDFIAEIESGAYDDLKRRPVVTYCTGGIRCEVLTAVMRNRGFEEVYQLDGGLSATARNSATGAFGKGSSTSSTSG